jgi:rubrerythrin
MEQNELIKLLKTHEQIEKEHVVQLSKIEKQTGNAAAKLLLLEMHLDSEKHAGIIAGILETLKGAPKNKTLWQYELESYVDPVVVRRSVENHIKMEQDVLAHVEEEIKKSKDEGIKLLLQHIAEDEKKHHKILEEIIKNSYKIT